MKFTKIAMIGIFAAFTFSGCSLFSPSVPQDKADQITSLMDKYLDKKDGRDCSGFVSLINQKNDNIYFKESNLNKFYSDMGLKSEAIFNLYKNKNLISHNQPKVGDLIFFNNTTRATKNLKSKQIITHIGIVNKIYSDGTVRFMHNAGGKNKNGFINLSQKNSHKKGDKELNSYIVSCKNQDSNCLSSNRFAGFGKVKF